MREAKRTQGREESGCVKWTGSCRTGWKCLRKQAEGEGISRQSWRPLWPGAEDFDTRIFFLWQSSLQIRVISGVLAPDGDEGMYPLPRHIPHEGGKRRLYVSPPEMESRGSSVCRVPQETRRREGSRINPKHPGVHALGCFSFLETRSRGLRAG